MRKIQKETENKNEQNHTNFCTQFTFRNCNPKLIFKAFTLKNYQTLTWDLRRKLETKQPKTLLSMKQIMFVRPSESEWVRESKRNEERGRKDDEKRSARAQMCDFHHVNVGSQSHGILYICWKAHMYQRLTLSFSHSLWRFICVCASFTAKTIHTILVLMSCGGSQHIRPVHIKNHIRIELYTMTERQL